VQLFADVLPAFLLEFDFQWTVFSLSQFSPFLPGWLTNLLAWICIFTFFIIGAPSTPFRFSRRPSWGTLFVGFFMSLLPY